MSAGDLNNREARVIDNAIDLAERLVDRGRERVAALTLFIASFKADDAPDLADAMRALARELG